MGVGSSSAEPADLLHDHWKRLPCDALFSRSGMRSSFNVSDLDLSAGVPELGVVVTCLDKFSKRFGLGSVPELLPLGVSSSLQITSWTLSRDLNCTTLSRRIDCPAFVDERLDLVRFPGIA